MVVKDRLLSQGVKHGRSMRKMTPEGIVIHYVGNAGSGALGNRNYFENGSGGAGVSAHYIIGLEGEVLRCVPDDECAAHAGKSYGTKWDNLAKTNNSRFIGIECCHPTPDGKFNGKTYTSLIELCAQLCKEHNLNPKDDIYRHYDVSGKQCPLYYVKELTAWNSVIDDINRAFNNYAAQQAPKTDGCIPLLAPPSVTIAQMQTWARNKGAASFFIDLAESYYSLCVSIGLDPAVIYAQAGHETWMGTYQSSIIDVSWHNLCGLKIAEGGGDNDPNAHQRFTDWQTGQQAHIDHAALYAGSAGYPKPDSPDPRHFAYLYGSAKTVSKPFWGASDPFYFDKLIKHINDLRMTVAPVQQTQSAMEPMQSMMPTTPDAITVQPSEWAKDAWAWAVKNMLTDGTMPKNNITREQTIQIFYNFCKFWIAKLQG